MSDRVLWREALSAYIRREARPAYKFGHQPRLYELTKAIAINSPGLLYNDDIVFAAAFLHDLGVFVGHRPEDPRQLAQWNHVEYACQQAPALLQSIGFPEADIPAVLSCIGEHQPQDEPYSPEATLLRDADILEQLGAIGILRTSSKVGNDTRFHQFSDVQSSLRRAVDTLPGKLRLPASLELAAPRIEALRTFLDALAQEACGHLG